MSLSLTEAEYIALATCVQSVKHVTQLLIDFNMTQGPLNVYEDNEGAIKLTKNWSFTRRTKHIDIRHHFVRNLVEDGMIKICHIKTDRQPADALTKALPRGIYEKHIKYIMNEMQ